MIGDTLANYISRDFSCILGLSTLELSGSLFIVSPLNKKYTYPALSNASINSAYNPESPLNQLNEWSKESGIYTLSSNDIISNNFISSETDWNISTIINLSPSIDEATHGSDTQSNENYSFITTISLDESKIQSLDNIFITYTEPIGVSQETGETIYEAKSEYISLSKSEFLTDYINPTTPKEIAIKSKINEIIENAKVQIFKQGFDNLDGVLDCYMHVYKTSNEFFASLEFKVYYFNGLDVSTINLHTISIDLNDSLVKKFISNFSSLNVILDSSNGFVKLFINNDFIESKALDLIKINNSTLNYPSSNSDESKKFILGGVGTKCLKMRDFFIFKRILLDYELSFLNIINKGTFVNYEDALTLMALESGTIITLNKIGDYNLNRLQYKLKQFDPWKLYYYNTPITLENVGDYVQFKNDGSYLAESPKKYVQFDIEGLVGMTGDINSLSNYSTLNSFRFYKLLSNVSSLNNIPDKYLELSNLELVIDTSNSNEIELNGMVNVININCILDCFIREINNNTRLDVPEYKLMSTLPEGLTFENGIISGVPTKNSSGVITILVSYEDLESKNIEIQYNFV